MPKSTIRFIAIALSVLQGLASFPATVEGSVHHALRVRTDFTREAIPPVLLSLFGFMPNQTAKATVLHQASNLRHLLPFPIAQESRQHTPRLQRGYDGPSLDFKEFVREFTSDSTKPALLEVYEKIARGKIYRGVPLDSVYAIGGIAERSRAQFRIHSPSSGKDAKETLYTIRKVLGSHSVEIIARPQSEDADFGYLQGVGPIVDWGYNDFIGLIPKNLTNPTQVFDLFTHALRLYQKDPQEVLGSLRSLVFEFRPHPFLEETIFGETQDGQRTVTIILDPSVLGPKGGPKLHAALTEAAAWVAHGPEMSQHDITVLAMTTLIQQISVLNFLEILFDAFTFDVFHLLHWSTSYFGSALNSQGARREEALQQGINDFVIALLNYIDTRFRDSRKTTAGETRHLLPFFSPTTSTPSSQQRFRQRFASAA